METIIYRLKLEGGDVIIKDQQQLKKVVKSVNDEFQKTARGADGYEDISKNAAVLKDLQSQLRRESRELGKANRVSIGEAVGSYNFWRSEVERLTAAFKRLGTEQKESTEGRQLKANLDNARKEFGKLRAELDEGLYNNFFNGLTDSFQNFAAALTGDIGAISTALGFGGPLGVAFQVIGDGVGQLDLLAEKITKVRGEVQQLTDFTGDDLSRVTSSILALGKTFQVPENELLLAANSLTDQLTGDFDESLRLIEEGFLAGANANGDFLRTLQEYPSQFDLLSVSGGQFISVVTQAVREGVFSDKGADAFKEVGLRLRELTPAAEDALNAIGITSAQVKEDIENGGIGLALTNIQTRLREFPDDSQEVGLVLADVFGGAGEDAAIQFIKNVDIAKDSVGDLIDPTNDLVATQQRQLALQKDLAAAQQQLVGETGPFITELKLLGSEVLVNVVQLLSQFIGILREVPAFIKENSVEIGVLIGATLTYNRSLIASTALTLRDVAVKKGAVIATNAMAVAQRALNFVLNANPIGIVVTTIGALIIGLRQAYKRSQTFRASLAGLSAVAGEVFTIVKEAVGSFIDGVRNLREGNFQDAFNDFGTAFIKSNPVSLAFSEGNRLQDAFNRGFADKIKSEIDESREDQIIEGLVGGNVRDKAKEAGESVEEGFQDGISEESARTKSILEKRKKEIEDALEDLDPKSNEFKTLTAELQKVKKEIESIDNAIDGTSTFEGIQGSIPILKKEIQELKDFIEKGSNSDNVLRDKIEEVIEKEAELDKVTAALERVRIEVSRSQDNALVPLASLDPNVNSQAEAGPSFSADIETPDFQRIAQANIQFLERQRLERLNALSQQNLDEEKFAEERRKINVEAEAAILRQRLQLVDRNSKVS